jgi:hypothetical protein
VQQKAFTLRGRLARCPTMFVKPIITITSKPTANAGTVALVLAK